MILLKFVLSFWVAQLVVVVVLLLGYGLGQSKGLVSERLADRKAVATEELVEGDIMKLSVVILLVVVLSATGCEQARTFSTSSQSTSRQAQNRGDFHLVGYKHSAGPHGMDLFTFTHQGRTITATCEQDGGDGSCSGLIPKVGEDLVGADDIRGYSAKTESVSATTNGKLEIFSAPGKPAPEICNGCLKMGDPAFSLWIQSVEVPEK
jgi:hypothetical protein